MDRSNAEAIAAKLEAAKPAAEHAPGGPAPDAPKAKKTPKPKGVKGVQKIVDELRKSLELITDDTSTVYLYSADGGAWSPLSEQRLLAMALNQDMRASNAKRRDIVAYLRARSYQCDLKWGRVADSEIACVNGILDVLTWEMRPHDSKNMLERSLPVIFDSKAKALTWEAALDTWFPKDKDGGRRAALQEYLGYVCLQHAKYKRAGVLFGETNTGKTVPVMVAKALVGDAYTCQLGVEDMDDPVRRAVLKGKALNVLTELSAEALIADGGFKTLISTEEPVLLDAKYRPPEMYVPTAKHLIATNNLPRLNDHTSATFNRLLIIPFTEEITEDKQDRGLLDKLKAELPGILLWAAEGARRLVQRQGQWPVVEAARSIITNYRDEMNPIRQFMQERMVKLEGALTPLQEITYQFNLWNTGSRNFGIKYVGKLLRACSLGGEIRDAKVKGRTLTCLRGYRLVAKISDELQEKASTGTLTEGGIELVEAVTVVRPDGDAAPAATERPSYDEDDMR